MFIAEFATDQVSDFINLVSDFNFDLPAIVDVLMTNFHLPKSTLFMLICAFAGKENAFALYKQAISEKYRFYSYGDSSLLFRHQNHS